jgi:HK97 family phage prohead protease
MIYEPGTRYIFSDGKFVKQKPIRESTTRRSNRGFVIEGIGTKYNTIMYESSGRYIDIQPGAFDISLKYEAPVKLRLDHDSKLAMPGCRVELFSDEEGLNFRVHLSDSEICNHARDLVESGLYSQCSLGWHSSKISKRDIGGTEVNFILAGTLTEVSLLPTGACPTTHCQVSELKNCRSLREDVESKKFRSDNSYVELQRALQRLDSE